MRVRQLDPPETTDVASSQGAVAGGAPASWLGQPRGLAVLFLTEAWERFSFYGMRALLVYYMTKQLHFPAADSSLVYGGYEAAVFLTPLLGASVADGWLGKRTCVLLGGALMAVGHFAMAFESLFFAALGAIALGSGFLVPCLASQVRGLYGENDPRLSSAYNIYYVGINLGGFLAPLVCGTIGELYGWHWGFTVAGFGMVVGLCIYLFGMRYLPPQQLLPPRRPAAVGLERAERRCRFALLIGIMSTIIVFRAAYEQIGNTVALWSDTGVDRQVTAHWSVPATWFQALNPLLVFLLTPLVVGCWVWLARRGRHLAALKKMIAGAALVGLSYLLIAAVAAHSDAPIRWPWFVTFFVLMTGGELLILPVGWEFFARFAPRSYEATGLAIWIFAGSAGALLAGALGAWWSRLAHADFFAIVGATALLAAVLLAVFVPATMRIEKDNSAHA
jgi:proton-dependent oligopeptide transporter, POT family